MYAKMARGAIARFVAARGLNSPDGLKDFTGTGNEWSFDAHASTSDVFVFKRGSSKKSDSNPVSRGKVKVEVEKPASSKKASAQAEAAVPSKKVRAAAKSGAKKSTRSPHPPAALKMPISKASAPTKPSAALGKLRSQTKNAKAKQNTPGPK